MRKAYAKKIDARSTQLLQELNLKRVPIDVLAVAKGLGARVVFDDLEDDVSGFLLRDKDVSTIAVNKRHHPNRQRFTLAHECGHLHLHAAMGDRLWLDKAYFYRDSSSSQGDHLAEIEANQFAAGLLMPEDLIFSSIGAADSISDVDVVRLAMQFEVSERAMTFRLISLDLLGPVAA